MSGLFGRTTLGRRATAVCALGKNLLIERSK
jgi:hypothetical protein